MGKLKPGKQYLVKILQLNIVGCLNLCLSDYENGAVHNPLLEHFGSNAWYGTS